MLVNPVIALDDALTFRQLLDESKRDFWKIDEVFPATASLDLSRPLLPSSLTGLSSVGFLGQEELLRLNQITGKSYVNIFHFVEEYIIRDIKRLKSEADENSHESQALDRFVSEEVKHQALFRRFIDAFDRDFGAQTDVLDFADDVADLILGNSPLAVLLTTFHLEIITQEHYLQAIEPSEEIEPHMISILRHHWLDESRHAAMDYLEIKRLCARITPEERALGFQEYLGILDAFFELLSMQASHDMAAFQELGTATLGSSDALRLQHLQHQAYATIFLVVGLRHPALREVVDKFIPGKLNELDFLADKFRLE